MKRLIPLLLAACLTASAAPVGTIMGGPGRLFVEEGGGGGDSLVHGEPFTISGTGFGTKTVAAPLVYDNFEAGTVGADITGNVAAAGELETVDDIVDSLLVILEKLDTAMEADGEDYRFTANALEQAPSGEGGGTNITQIKGRDAETVIDERVTAQLTTYDPPTRAELTSDIGSVLSAVSGLNDISAEDVWNVIIEDQGGGIIARCAMAANVAYVAGDLSTIGNDSTYRDPSGTETRITGTAASAGNRTASVTCPSY